MNEQVVNTTENNYEVTFAKISEDDEAANRLEMVRYSYFKKTKTDVHK